MSVKGSLESVGLEDLLQAGLASQGGGRLTLRHGPHYAALYLDADGLYVLQPDLMLPDLLLEAFTARGLLDPDLLARSRRSHLHGMLLLDHLVEEGHVPEAEYMEVLAAEVEDTVLDMMLWDEGWFRFERQPLEQGQMGLLARICVDPEGVAARALERLDERRLIGDLLGNHALLFMAEPGKLPDLKDEGDRLHEVHARLDGSTVIHEIALHLGCSRFAVLEAIVRLYKAKLARPADAAELVREATTRTKASQHTLSRRLMLQWAEATPEDPGPLHKLASLAVEAADRDGEIEALCALGHLHLKKGESAEGLEVFTQAMRQAPADDVVLAGLRMAAEAAGDNDTLVDSTLLNAQTKLDEGDADEALTLLEALEKTHPANMSVHLLRARALVQSQKRTEFFEHAEAVGRVLASEGCRSKADREAVDFFRETIAHLAPDRGDLLERFRTIYDPRNRKRRAFALMAALVLTLAGAGVYLWPASAAGLLSQAHEAADEGDKELARSLIGQLVDRFPEAPETEQAFLLQARLFPPRAATSRRERAVRELKEAIDTKMPAFTDALPVLPDQDAQGSVRAVLDLLSNATAKQLRGQALKPVVSSLRKTAQRLLDESLARVSVLAKTAGAHDRHKDDPQTLGTFLDEAARVREPAWITNVRATSELLYRLARLHEDEDFRRLARELVRGTDSLAKAVGYYDEHIPTIRLAHGSMQVEDADRACREDAPKLMVGGHLDQADALYARLESLLTTYASEPAYARLIEAVTKRQLPQLIRDRRAQIADIRAQLAAAAEAEARGDVPDAVRRYAHLVKEHWLIRFENVFTLPLRVETVPAGARIMLAGREIGISPAIVRYAWGSEASITLHAPGYADGLHTLLTAEDKPPSKVSIALTPAPQWRRDVSKRIGLPPTSVDGHVLSIERGGTLTLHDREDGHVRWTKPHRSLEGVRGRPALGGGRLCIPHVDGTVLFVDAASGEERGRMKLDRLQGDAAAVGARHAMTTTAGALVIVEGGKEVHRVELGAAPSAGVVAGHGAFWVGTVQGVIVRVNAASGEHSVIQAALKQGQVLALSADADGMYATTAGGALLALTPEGSERWRHAKVGDLVGAPARAGAVVAVVERGGRLVTFAAKDGESAREYDCGGRPVAGPIGSAATVFLQKRDGSLWCCDTSDGRVLLNAGATFRTRFGPTLLPGARIALEVAQGKLGVIPAPRAPKR